LHDDLIFLLNLLSDKKSEELLLHFWSGLGRANGADRRASSFRKTENQPSVRQLPLARSDQNQIRHLTSE
jgi:hypothetical protein